MHRPSPAAAEGSLKTQDNPRSSSDRGSRSSSDRGSLAARLAKSPEEKRLVRDTALRLIGVGMDDDYRVTKTLQLVQSELGESIGLLAQGSWTLRSLAAILWAESSDMPDELGIAFGQDYDVRVRRALATALANKDDLGSTHVRDVLQADPRWSVRSILRSTNS
jgi:hypothetical protein